MNGRFAPTGGNQAINVHTTIVPDIRHSKFFSQQEPACRTGRISADRPYSAHGDGLFGKKMVVATSRDLARSGEISGSLGIKFAATVRPRRRLRCRLRPQAAADADQASNGAKPQCCERGQSARSLRRNSAFALLRPQRAAMSISWKADWSN